MSGPPDDLAAAGRRVGEHRWLELQVFELAGRWVPETTEAPAKLALDRHSGHGAWRAGQWEDRLPVLAGVDPQGLVSAPSAAWDRCVAQLTGERETVARLAGLYRVVLPRIAQRYRAHLAASSPVAEGPTRRTLRLLLPDVGDDRDEGDDVLAALLVDRATIDAAAASVSRMEAAFLSQGTR